MINAGDRVWYWSRRKGERAHQKFGMVLSTDGQHARVKLEVAWGVEPVPPVRTVEAKRLVLDAHVKKET